jgi:WXXGXW repeat (2 copies)
MRKVVRALVALLLLAALPLVSAAAVVISVGFAPPALPLYVPPPIPAPGYLWVPGYWAWSPGGYYWVPGTWALAPAPGLLWTPGYWGWAGGAYLWHAGYWGPHVGFYGGVNYGFGYSGVGYHGGYWSGGHFVANTTVIREGPVNRVSFNGGAGGIVAHASPAEVHAAAEHHLGMSSEQLRHEQLAARDKTMRADYNHGAPPVAGTQKPGVFSGHGVVAAHAPGASGAGTAHAPLAAAYARAPGGSPAEHAYGTAAGHAAYEGGHSSEAGGHAQSDAARRNAPTANHGQHAEHAEHGSEHAEHGRGGHAHRR